MCYAVAFSCVTVFRSGVRIMNYSSLIARFELFVAGEERRAYEIFGVHKEDSSYIFRVYAPHADRVMLVGDFNSWQDTHPMVKIYDGGIWQAEIPSDTVNVGDMYKYKLIRNGAVMYRADPYGYKMEAPPNCASVIADIDGYKWHDGGWMAQRREESCTDLYSRPLNIYELHTASWKRHEDGSLYGYRELAQELAPYVKQMGYTHVELMPICEHPFGGSWGYQVGGYYAPASKHGTPKDLMEFMDVMHSAGVGVILDWVPAHFPTDEFGLHNFDGAPLYGYDDPERAINPSWGTVRFDMSRGHVRSFLISNAIYWMEKYHVDGIRVDAVSSIVYIDCEGSPKGSVPDNSENNLCVEGIEFLKQLTRSLKNDFPDAMVIAEESGAFGGVTSRDGLGFDLKWNMGWMHDTLSYAEVDFKDRPDVHGRLTFPLMYAFNERSVLPISHDEVVYGKKSFLDKMPGDYWRKFAGARAFEALKMTMPGKKLTFMGCEIGQFREWSCDESVEWFLLDFESHARHQLYCADLNNFYLAHPELWQSDDGWHGFSWLEPDDRERCVISYVRRDRAGRELIVAVNLTPKAYDDFFLPVTSEGSYEEVFNSDSEKYGGSGVTNASARFSAGPNPSIGFHRSAEDVSPYAVRLRLPPLGVTVLQRKN